MDEDDEPPLAADEAARHRHIADDLRGLFDSGITLVKAEAELQKARASYAAGKAKWIGLLGLLAIMLVFFALVALTVGLVVGLTPLLGAIVATLAVFGGLVIAALVAALVAAGQWKRMVKALANGDQER